MQGGGGPAEPVLSKQSELADDVKSNAKGREPAPVRASETGRARNWTMPPLRLERECKERSNSATIDNRCVEFDRRESTESTAIIGLRALGRRIAFTMAEILLSLTIIGVVAAITLPSLTGNINERTWNTQRKALYARFSQAIALMPALNGYGTLRETTDSAGSTSIEDTAAETFVTNGLSKVLKINNICDSEHIEDCGITAKFTALNGSIISTPTKMSELNRKMLHGTGSDSFSFLDTQAVAFETVNGESVLTFYNPSCVSGMKETSNYYVQPKICVNFVFDLNGSKGPNTVGKDIGFMTVLYSTDSAVVAPNVPVQKAAVSVSQYDALSACRKQDPEYRIPSLDELASMFVNQQLINGELSGDAVYWSATLYSSLSAWEQGFNLGRRSIRNRSNEGFVHCVKR